MISSDFIRELREKTGVSVMECKKALEEAKGNIERAVKVLEKRFGNMAAKRAGREAGAGIVETYVHSNGKVGVMLALKTETDFVARNPAFKELAHDIALQIASMDPQDRDSLMAQSFIKDPSRTVKDLIESAIGKFGENIKVGKFIRYEI